MPRAKVCRQNMPRQDMQQGHGLAPAWIVKGRAHDAPWIGASRSLCPWDSAQEVGAVLGRDSRHTQFWKVANSSTVLITDAVG